MVRSDISPAFIARRLRDRVAPVATRSVNFLRARGIPCGTEDTKLWNLKGRFRGERIFVVGSGPSLCVEDLARLGGEYSFGVNRIYKIYERTGWRPNFFTAIDRIYIGDMEKIINLNSYATIFFPSYFGSKNGLYRKSLNFRLCDDRMANPWPAFSSNAIRGIYQGFTVTYVAIQLAVHMGFKQIYLLAIDHNYVVPKIASTDADGLNLVHYDNEPNYFIADYHTKGDLVYAPRIDDNERAYRAARRYCDANGIIIRNATRGGKLELFERVDFDTLF